jgi:hypothetical protein
VAGVAAAVLDPDDAPDMVELGRAWPCPYSGSRSNLDFGTSRSGVKGSNVNASDRHSYRRNGERERRLATKRSMGEGLWPEEHLECIRLVIIALRLCSPLALLTFVYFIVLDGFGGASARRTYPVYFTCATSTVTVAMRTYSICFILVFVPSTPRSVMPGAHVCKYMITDWFSSWPLKALVPWCLS